MRIIKSISIRLAIIILTIFFAGQLYSQTNSRGLMFKPGEEKDAVFFKPDNATMIANTYSGYAFDTSKTKLSLPNTQWQGPIINTTKQATAKFAKLSAFKVSEFKNTLHGEFLPKGNGVKRGPKSEKLNIWSMTAIPGFWDIEPKTLLIPYGGKMDAKFVAVLDKKCDWSIGNTILKSDSNEISLAFEDATQNSWDKKNATINYFEPRKITIKGTLPRSSDTKEAIVNIVGIQCLSVNQPNISTSDSSLEGSSKKIHLVTSSTASLNLLNSQGDICIEIDSLPASVTLQASPSLSSGGIFPDGYPKWYVNGEEMSGENGKASITLDVGTLVKKQDEVVITAKCSEKEVNYKSVIGSDGSITTNGNERFCSHSITFSKSSIQMTKPAGIYTSPTADTSDTDGLSYKQLDDEGKTIAGKKTIPGSNEFVFDQNKDGKLTIQFEAKVVGSKKFRESMNEGAFYFVPGELENYAAADIVWKDSKGGSAESPCIYDPETGIVSAEVTYNKMPSSNNAFGYKTVKLMYKPKEGDVVEVTKSNYEIFFNKEGTSHPACTTCADCPNWFYYWKKGEVCTLLERAQFDSNLSDTTMGEYTYDSGIIRLGKNAASDYVEKIILTWNGNKANIDCNSKGSDLRAVAIWSKHELTHELIYLEKKESINDADKDDVSNQLETTGNGISDIAIKSDPNVPDTYGLVSKFIANGMDNPAKIAEYMEKIKQTTGLKNPVELERLAKEQLRAEIDAIYSGYATYADNELRARVHSGNVKRGRDYFPEKDWAYPGTNQD